METALLASGHPPVRSCPLIPCFYGVTPVCACILGLSAWRAIDGYEIKELGAARASQASTPRRLSCQMLGKNKIHAYTLIQGTNETQHRREPWRRSRIVADGRCTTRLRLASC